MIRTPLLAAALLGLAAPALAAPAPGALTPPAAPTAADWRAVDPQNVVVIDTTKGRIVLELYPEVAPNFAARVRELAKAGLYDGRAFFRVIDNFMAQTGDPKDTGEGGSDKPDIPAEFTFRRSAQTPFVLLQDQTVADVGFVGTLPVKSQSAMLMPMTADNKVNAWGLFCPGVAGAARSDNPDSANSQFFLMRHAYPSLDKRYTAFGRVLIGEEVVRGLKVGEPPQDPDKMTKVQVLADMPVTSRPKIRVVDTKSAWFKAEVAYQMAAKGQDLTACDIEIPAEMN